MFALYDLSQENVWSSARKIGPLRLPLNCEAKCRHRCLLLMLTCGNCSLNIEVAWRWSRNLISGSSQIIFFLMHEKSSRHIIRSLINECKQFLDFPTINMEPARVNRRKWGGGGGYSFQYLFKNVLSFLHKRRGNGMFSIKTTELLRRMIWIKSNNLLHLSFFTLSFHFSRDLSHFERFADKNLTWGN